MKLLPMLVMLVGDTGIVPFGVVFKTVPFQLLPEGITVLSLLLKGCVFLLLP